MDIIIKSNLKTLTKAKFLLANLEDNIFCDISISPYYSSIGTHLRHILDFYDCIFKLNPENKIDLTSRTRNKEVESKCYLAKGYLNSIIDKLNTSNFNMNETVYVLDDLGLGMVEVPYTVGALFSQANSHTIHHYAIINYILEGLNISINDSNFGFNPTTRIQNKTTSV